MSSKEVDLVVLARWVIPIKPAGFFENYALVVDQGKILDLLPLSKYKSQYVAKKELNLSEQHVVLPGLINTHCHSAMSLLRGYAEDCSLMDWLLHYMWPAEGMWVNPDFIEVGSSLSVIELLKFQTDLILRNGVTCFNDMYFFPEVTAQVVKQSGMRAVIGAPVVMFPSAYSANQDQCLEKAEHLFQQYKDDDKISISISPHSPYTVSDDGLKKSKQLADKYHARCHIHVHETETEIDNHVNDPLHGGVRPIERLNRLGLIDERLIAVHMTQLIEEEIQLFTMKKANVSSCPSSNLKLSSGTCPINKLVKAGVNVSLGTDGPASNDDLSILYEMRLATLLERHSRSRNPLHVQDILELATINGAKALGLEHKIGSLEIGKDADFIAIRLDTVPVYNPLNTLTYVSSNMVEHVFVGGKCLVENGNVLTMDVLKLRKKAAEWGIKIHQWDMERRKVPKEKLQNVLDRSIKAATLQPTLALNELQDLSKQLQSYRDQLFHWIFFAGLTIRNDNSPPSISKEELQEFFNSINHHLQIFETMIKNVSST